MDDDQDEDQDEYLEDNQSEFYSKEQFFQNEENDDQDNMDGSKNLDDEEYAEDQEFLDYEQLENNEQKLYEMQVYEGEDSEIESQQHGMSLLIITFNKSSETTLIILRSNIWKSK